MCSLCGNSMYKLWDMRYKERKKKMSYKVESVGESGYSSSPPSLPPSLPVPYVVYLRASFPFHQMSIQAADIDRDLITQLELEISNMLSKDEVLSNIPSYATVQELEALLAVEKGQAYNISIERSPLPSIGNLSASTCKISWC
ncbi:U11/U12 small nuclear ribonucleoprotein, variant 2 [Mucor circinelloides]